jgi:putative peptidoglycan lipid II flippase
LYSNAFYALGDTRTPTAFAVIRVSLVAGLGYLLAITAPPLAGIPLRWGAAGLTISAGFAGWIEFLLLRRALVRRVGALTIRMSFVARSWAAAATAALLATALRWVIPSHLLLVRGLVLIGVYGVVYLLIAHRLGLLAADDLVRRIFRRGRASETKPQG